jgi:hypothetical protein
MKKMKKSSTKKQVKKTVSKTKTSTKKQTPASASDKSVKSVENGIKVIQYAIKNKTSISEAARKNGHGRNYVSDIKARIEKNYKSRSIKRELYNSFKSLSKTYDKTVG